MNINTAIKTEFTIENSIVISNPTVNPLQAVHRKEILGEKYI